MDIKWAVRVCAVVAVTAGTLVAASPAMAANGGRIYTGGTAPVNIRSGPGTNYSVVGSIAVGAGVNVSCVATGTAVTGPYGTTTWWDNIGNNRWVTDAYVDTGTNDPIAMGCDKLAGTSTWMAGEFNGLWSQVAGCGFTSHGYMAITGHVLHSQNKTWWYLDSPGCPFNGYYISGTGTSATLGNYAEWYAYPGAGARCTITMDYPAMGNATTRAQYYVQTNSASLTQIAAPTLNQAAGASDLGTFTVDGTGFLRVILVDSSPAAGQQVGAGSMELFCHSTF